jgi:hypothetical protein
MRVFADLVGAILRKRTVRRVTLRASVYRHKRSYFVIASSPTTDGFWFENGPVAIVPLGLASELGDAVREALDRSGTLIRAPKDWSSHVNRVVEAAGLKRYAAFAKSAALVSVSQEDEQLRLVPHRNGGSDGFVGLEDETIGAAAMSQDLGRLIELAFDRCD